MKLRSSLIIVFVITLFITLAWFMLMSADEKIYKGQTTILQTTSVPQPLTIILSAHFDDAALSLGGLMAKNKNKKLVATFFGGKPDKTMYTEWDRRSGFTGSDEAIPARIQENQFALAPFGAEIINYNYLDFQYREDKGVRENLEIKNQLIQDIKSLIEQNKSNEIFIYGPAAFGSKITHPDHQILHDAFMAIVKSTNQAKTHFFIYEDFPYIYQFENTNAGEISSYLNISDNILIKRITIGFTGDKLARKIDAIDAYTSQVIAFKSFGDDIGFLAKEFYRQRCEEIPAYACEVVYEIYRGAE